MIGLGAGAYGETGRGIQEYHELIANHASTIRDSAVSCIFPLDFSKYLYLYLS
jgi:hypothetical protein